MRSDMDHAREHLLEHLHHAAGVVKLTHDGSDFVLVERYTGEKIILYIVESTISLHEIKKMLTNHTAQGWYTLFLFWADMLLPSDGELFLPQEWMAGLLPLYKDKLYGFDIANDREVVVFPVHFETHPQQRQRLIHYGARVNFDDLRGEEIRTEHSLIPGFWRVAGFSVAEEKHEANVFSSRTALSVYFDTLQITATEDIEVIRIAYRQLARQFHPDVNPTPEAHTKMQEINEAYRQLMARYGQ